MKLEAYAGVRKDNGEIVEAFLREEGDTPASRLFTDDRVKVDGITLFELELPTGMNRLTSGCSRTVERDLMMALAITLHHATPEVRSMVERHVPNLKLR